MANLSIILNISNPSELRGWVNRPHTLAPDFKKLCRKVRILVEKNVIGNKLDLVGNKFIYNFIPLEASMLSQQNILLSIF